MFVLVKITQFAMFKPDLCHHNCTIEQNEIAMKKKKRI